ncbi:hypothetical protein BGZ76_004146 [Entomortierella beljakovae]|nr:hypothetical protein BGZ76_004146 [Entomortierella beljakovae]
MDHNSMETYFGLIKTPQDALIIFEGKSCHIGVISRVHRRLSDIERQCVRSGSVYCFDEREAGMRRWTDGKSWSPSRVTGSFLTYRELDDSQGNGGKNVYRPDGLLKQSFSITTADNKKLHLISYYTNEDVASERLFETPSRDPRFANIVVPKGIYPETSPHADSHSHSTASTNHSSPSPPTRTRHRPHHRAFLHKDEEKAEIIARRRESSSAYNVGHRRTYSNGPFSYKDQRYSPIQANFPDNRSRSNSQSVPYPTNLYGSYGPGPEKRHRSSSPSAASSFPTPPFHPYSPSSSWASDDDHPLVSDTVAFDSIDSRAPYNRRDDDLAPVMIPALRELPLLATSFDHHKAASLSSVHEPYSPAPTSAASEQDSLSVLANLATDTLLLPKLEPKELIGERVRWVEDDRQLRALSSMLRL